MCFGGKYRAAVRSRTALEFHTMHCTAAVILNHQIAVSQCHEMANNFVGDSPF